MSSGPQQSVTKEVFVKVTKSQKKYHALKFNSSNDVDFKSNTKAELAREGGHYQYKAEWEALPKAGTGSEFNRENKEMARRKKFGFQSKGHNIDDLPWILTTKAADGKELQYRAKRSVSDNSSYFVFINNKEVGGFEAYPLEDWYTFTPYRTYKTLTIEEAEEEFSKRHTILNKYAIMANRRKTKNDADEEGTGGTSSARGGGGGDDDDEGGKGKGKSKAAKKDISDWIMSGDEDENLSDDDDDEGGAGDGSDEEKSGGKKKKGKKKGGGGGGGDDDGDEMKVNEDSDDGDHEGDELDYTSSEDDDEEDFEHTKNEEKYEEKGIDEEAPMKALEEEEDEDEEEKNLTEEGREYKKLISQTMKEDDEETKDSAKKSAGSGGSPHSGSDSSDIEDPDNDPNIVSVFDNKKGFLNAASSFNESSTTASKSQSKRKATDDLSEKTSSKRSNTTDGGESTKTIKANLIKAATIATAAAAAASAAPATPSLMFEDEVVRYLKRKPMTVKELINKLKKNSTMSNKEINEHLRKIFDKLKQSKDFKVEEKNGTKYLSLYAPGK